MTYTETLCEICKNLPMRIFPSNKYIIELNSSVQKNIELLRINTKESRSLTSQTTDKQFIGRINGEQFELISSLIGIGAFTVFKGKFTENFVTLTTEINKPFKILLSIIFALGLVGVGHAFYRDGFVESIGLFIPLIMMVVFLRFVMIGLSNKISISFTLERLKNVLN